jgi:sortase (surface protein transpeptidase)
MANVCAVVRLIALWAVVPVLAACGGPAQSADTADTTDTAEAAAPVGTSVQAEKFRSSRTHPAVAPPVRLRIPKVGVDSGLERLGTERDGTIEVPDDPDTAGWFAEGPRPGQRGPAVILGHVDSKAGPAVFIDLDKLRPGDRVHVDRSDGSTASFRVTRLVRVPKDRFPTELVYAPTLDATLRLVTCGGVFDYRSRNYRDNVIVLADAV